MSKTKIKQAKMADVIKQVIKRNEQLAAAGESKVVIDIVGTHGIGKTSLLIAVAESLDYRVTKLNLSQIQELSDLIGFPIREYQLFDGRWINETQLGSVDPMSLTGETRTAYCPPVWVPTDNSKVILLLDDWTRAESHIIQAAMELINRGEFVSWKLPPSVIIMLTSNIENGDYNVSTLDEAQKTRRISIEMEFDPVEWAAMYAEGKVDSRIINFALAYPELFAERKTNIRSLTDFSKLVHGIEYNETNFEYIRIMSAAALGEDVSTLFSAFLAQGGHKIPSFRQVIDMNDKTAQQEFMREVFGTIDDENYQASSAFGFARRAVAYLKSAKNNPADLKEAIKTAINVFTTRSFASDLRQYIKLTKAQEADYFMPLIQGLG